MGSCCKVFGNTGSGMRVPLALSAATSVPGVLLGSPFTRVPLIGSKKVAWILSSMVSPEPVSFPVYCVMSNRNSGELGGFVMTRYSIVSAAATNVFQPVLCHVPPRGLEMILKSELGSVTAAGSKALSP